VRDIKLTTPPVLADDFDIQEAYDDFVVNSIQKKTFSNLMPATRQDEPSDPIARPEAVKHEVE